MLHLYTYPCEYDLRVLRLRMNKHIAIYLKKKYLIAFFRPNKLFKVNRITYTYVIIYLFIFDQYLPVKIE